MAGPPDQQPALVRGISPPYAPRLALWRIHLTFESAALPLLDLLSPVLPSSRYVYDMYYRYKKISRELYQYCLDNVRRCRGWPLTFRGRMAVSPAKPPPALLASAACSLVVVWWLWVEQKYADAALIAKWKKVRGSLPCCLHHHYPLCRSLVLHPDFVRLAPSSDVRVLLSCRGA